MKLSNAARYFDDIPLVDPYTNLTLPYKAQFSTFDEAAPDGSVSKARSMSLAPGLALPARRAVRILTETWLLGEPNNDGIFGKAIRQTVPMKRTTDYISVRTPGELLGAAPGVSVWTRKDYLKSTVDGTTSANYYPFFNLYFAGTEVAPNAGMFFQTLDGSLFRARSKYATKTGFTCLESDQLTLDDAVTTADFGTGAYDPITDSYGATTATYPVVVLLPHQLLVRKDQADPTFMQGDLTVLVRTTDLVAPEVGQTLTIDSSLNGWVAGSGAGRIVSVSVELDCWNLHVRRV